MISFNLKKYLVFFTIATVVFTFPLQVFSKSNLFALVPYLFLFLLFIYSIFENLSNNNKIQLKTNSVTRTIYLYILLVFFTTLFQSIMGWISISQFPNITVNFLFPSLFFIYFNYLANDNDFKMFFYSSFIIGLLSTTYLIYDSYNMFFNGVVLDYSREAFDYQKSQRPDLDLNDGRILAYYRAYGLLESHSVSATWVSLTGFSFLAINNNKSLFIRSLISLLFVVVLILCQNYTAIFCFTIVLILFEFKFNRIFKGFLSKVSIRLLVYSILLIFSLTLVITIFNIKPILDLVDPIKTLLEIQYLVITGGSEYVNNQTYLGEFFTQLINYPKYILVDPISFIIGDGFSNHGIEKGGDFGLVETIYRFGIFFSIFFIVGIIKIIKKTKYSINFQSDIKWINYLKIFTAYSIFYLLLNEIHYSVWAYKSILPVVFILIAFYNRFIIKTIQ